MSPGFGGPTYYGVSISQCLVTTQSICITTRGVPFARWPVGWLIFSGKVIHFPGKLLWVENGNEKWTGSAQNVSIGSGTFPN